MAVDLFRAALRGTALLLLASGALAAETAGTAVGTTFTLEAVHGAPSVAGLAFSPDGARVYSAGTDDLVRSWRAADLRLLNSFGHRGARIDSVAVSPDGSRVAGGDRDGSVLTWDPETGAELSRFGGNGRPIIGLSWGEQGVAVAALHGPVHVVDADTGRPLSTIRGPAEWFSRASFDMVGGHLAATGRDGRVRVWSLDGQQLATLGPEGVQTTQLTFDGSGARVAALDDSGTVRVWRVEDRELLIEHEGIRSGGLAFSGEGLVVRGPEGPLVLTEGGTRGLHAPPRWTGLPQGDETEDTELAGLHTRPDASAGPGGHIVEGYDDTLRTWDVPSGRLLASVDTGLAGVLSVDVSPDDSLLAMALATGRVLVRETLAGTLVGVLSLPDGPARALDWSPDGTQLALAGPDPLARTWAPLEGGRALPLYGHETPVMDLAFAPDGTLFSGSSDGEVLSWDLASRQPRRRFSTGAQGLVHLVAGAVGVVTWPALATAEGEPRLPLYDRYGQVKVRAELDHAGGWGALAPDGRTLASVDGEELALVSTATGQRLSLDRPPVAFRCVAWSRDSKLLAGGTSGGSVMVLRVEDGELIVSLRGHAGPVNALRFSDDGTLLVSGSADGTVRVWSHNR